jgi:predicted DNA-binding transcriptional regulator YafY
MANTSTRTLRLLSLLQARRYWPGTELAGQLQVSPRTLRRDVDRLRELGYPIQARRGVDGGYQLAAGTALPPLVVDDEEAVALAVGLQSAAQGAVEGIAEASVRALAKVVQVMPARLRRRVEALAAVTVPASWPTTARASVDPGLLTTAALACRDSERIRFSYTSASGEPTGRHVEPHRLVMLGYRWYLVGYDVDRHGWRSFRLDRLSAPRGTGTRYRPRELPAADAAAFVRAGIDQVRAAYEVEVLIEAPGAAVRERIGRWSSVEDIGATRCRVRMTTDSLDWPIMALGAVGADFQVISPPELLDRVHDWGRRFSQSGMGGAKTVGLSGCQGSPRALSGDRRMEKFDGRSFRQ